MKKLKLTEIEKQFNTDMLTKNEKCNIIGGTFCCCEGSTRSWRKSKKNNVDSLETVK